MQRELAEPLLGDEPDFGTSFSTVCERVDFSYSPAISLSRASSNGTRCCSTAVGWK
jgi:hypothetical protein